METDQKETNTIHSRPQMGIVSI